ncbi:MAG: hypothetical protein DI539_06080 [Flavobacterium psychrophilum]|nr:MAG: hypothetical protein DI539_06080 [Flavobacterium psychrophilum]
MKIFNLFAVLLFTVSAVAQDYKGYYVTESGKTVSGFFQEGDFNNMQSLKFKQSRGAEGQQLPSDVVVYDIEDLNLRFEKHNVTADASLKSSRFKDPVWEKRTLFLNVIVSGNATLYSYTKDYETVFFFKVKGIKQEEIEQLINKKYYIGDLETTENKAYKQQLYNVVNCNNQKKVSDYLGVIYDKSPLKKVFVEYNECTGSGSELYSQNLKTEFRYGFFASANLLNLGVDSYDPAVSNESSFGFSAGAEAAYIFPDQHWELGAKLEFETLNCELNDFYDQGFNVLESTFNLKGTALNLMFGPRYNFLLSDRSNIFIDANVCISQPFGEIEWYTTIHPINDGAPYRSDNGTYDLKTGFALNFGVGYTFAENYSVAVRYMTNRDYVQDTSAAFNTKLSRLGFVVGYRF